MAPAYALASLAHVQEDDRFVASDPAVELSSNRTAMSFERTAMSSDRTLMSVVRTSLSLIGFGFTIFQFFHLLNDEFLKVPRPNAPRVFSLALIVLGVALLTLGLVNHVRETRARRARRERLCNLGLIRHPEIVKTSSAMMIAVLLWLLGVVAIVDVLNQVQTVGQAMR
jgi:putative membrane protein